MSSGHRNIPDYNQLNILVDDDLLLAYDTSNASRNKVSMQSVADYIGTKDLYSQLYLSANFDTLPASFEVANNDLVAVYDVSTATLRQATAEELSNFAVQNGVFTPTGAATLRTLADRFQYFKSVMDFGAVGDGVTDDTQAFHDALASGGRIYTPPLTFAVGNILMPSGAVLYGNNGIMYDEVAAPNATILKALSGADCVIDVSGSRGYYLSDVILDGVDKEEVRGLTALTADSKHGTISRCSATRCLVGLGGSNGKYLRSTTFNRVISGNGGTGFSDTIDCFYNQITANANSSNGMSFTAGESSNSIGACSRIEFNGGDGISIFGASRIIICPTTLFDRNFKAGVSLSGALHCKVEGIFARNGRNNDASTEESHISIGGSCDNITIGSIVTRIGRDDLSQDPDQLSALTPKYAIEFASGGDTCTNITIEGNNLQGNTVSAFGGTFPTQSLIIRNNQGAPDLVIGQDINMSDGQVYQSKKSASSIASAGTAVLNMTNQPATGTLGESRELTVIVRRADTGAKFGASFKGVLDTEFGTNVLRLGSAFSEIGTAGSITTGGGGGTICDLVFGNFATDGSTFDITVTNNYGSSAITVEVILR